MVSGLFTGKAKNDFCAPAFSPPEALRMGGGINSGSIGENGRFWCFLHPMD